MFTILQEVDPERKEPVQDLLMLMLKVKLGTIFCEQNTNLLQHHKYVCDWPLIPPNYLYNFPV